jgi:hypothetical protein
MTPNNTSRPQWVRASVKLPSDLTKGYFILFDTKDSNNGCKAVGQFFYDKGELCLRYYSGTSGKWYNMDEILWHDESPQSSAWMDDTMSVTQLTIGRLEVNCFDEDSEMSIRVGNSRYQSLDMEKVKELANFLISHIKNETE